MQAIQYNLSIVEMKHCLNTSKEGQIFPQSFLWGGLLAPTPIINLYTSMKECSIWVSTYIHFTLVDHVKVVSFITWREK